MFHLVNSWKVCFGNIDWGPFKQDIRMSSSLGFWDFKIVEK